MNTLYYILFFAAGIAVDILYNRSKRIAVNNAYAEGFRHAKREEEYYRDGVSDGVKQNVYYYTSEKFAEMPDPKHAANLIPEHFMDAVHENGQATMQLK
jgi:hypothetical protein